jgi:hypothetical protein
VIAVFTKYDQFKREIRIRLEDTHGNLALLDDEVEETFQKEYLAHFKGSPRFVRLESEHYGPPTDILYANVCPRNEQEYTRMS